MITGEASLKPDRVVECGGEAYTGKNVVIATGSVPMMIPVPGHEYCIDSTGALALTELPASMVVMGGGVIGLELACAFAAFGTKITVVEMLPELLPREQKEAVRVLTREMKKLGISMKTGAKMLRIEKNGELLRAVYELKGAEEAVDCEQVLMAAGRKPTSAASMPRRWALRWIRRSASWWTIICVPICPAFTPSATWWAAISWPTPPMPRARRRWRTFWARTSPTAPYRSPSAPTPCRCWRLWV